VTDCLDKAPASAPRRRGRDLGADVPPLTREAMEAQAEAFYRTANPVRVNPAAGRSRGGRAWLNALAAPIRQACEELERELARQRRRAGGSRNGSQERLR
jgi:hypothetical protein